MIDSIIDNKPTNTVTVTEKKKFDDFNRFDKNDSEGKQNLFNERFEKALREQSGNLWDERSKEEIFNEALDKKGEKAIAKLARQIEDDIMLEWQFKYWKKVDTSSN